MTIGFTPDESKVLEAIVDATINLAKATGKTFEEVYDSTFSGRPWECDFDAEGNYTITVAHDSIVIEIEGTFVIEAQSDG